MNISLTNTLVVYVQKYMSLNPGLYCVEQTERKVAKTMFDKRNSHELNCAIALAFN